MQWLDHICQRVTGLVGDIIYFDTNFEVSSGLHAASICIGRDPSNYLLSYITTNDRLDGIIMQQARPPRHIAIKNVINMMPHDRILTVYPARTKLCKRFISCHGHVRLLIRYGLWSTILG